ncbi:hypothetical protein ABZ917_46945 [Nonomuraea wenchangensis]
MRRSRNTHQLIGLIFDGERVRATWTNGAYCSEAEYALPPVLLELFSHRPYIFASKKYWGDIIDFLHGDNPDALDVLMFAPFDPDVMAARESQLAGEQHRDEILSQIYVARTRHRLPSPEPSPIAKRVAAWASATAVEPESDEEWRKELQEVAATGTRSEVMCFALGLLCAALHSRATQKVEQLARPGIVILCWVLRSQTRTWTPLCGLLLWAGVETATDTGVGAAILVVLLAFSGLAWLVERLRNRYEAHPSQTAEEPSERGG